MTDNIIKAVLIKPDEKPEVIELQDKDIEKIVEGDFEILCLYGEQSIVLANKYAEDMLLPENRVLCRYRNGIIEPMETIRGNILIVGESDDEIIVSISDPDCEKALNIKRAIVFQRRGKHEYNC